MKKTRGRSCIIIAVTGGQGNVPHDHVRGRPFTRRRWPPKKQRFTFAVGIARSRTVTVHAMTEEEARMKVRAELDRRAARKNQEPPIGWDLELVR